MNKKRGRKSLSKELNYSFKIITPEGLSDKEAQKFLSESLLKKLRMGRAVLNIISNKLRLEILSVLKEHKEGINMANLSKEVNAFGEKYHYKAVVFHVKVLEKSGYVKTKREKKLKGRPVIVKPTEILNHPIYLVIKNLKLPILFDHKELEKELKKK